MKSALIMPSSHGMTNPQSSLSSRMRDELDDLIEEIGTETRLAAQENYQVLRNRLRTLSELIRRIGLLWSGVIIVEEKNLEMDYLMLVQTQISFSMHHVISGRLGLA